MASGDDHVGGGFSPASSGRNRGRAGGDARFTCVGSGGLWRKRGAKTRRWAGLVHHNEHDEAQRARRGRRSAVARSAFPSREEWRVRAAPTLPSCPLWSRCGGCDEPRVRLMRRQTVITVQVSANASCVRVPPRRAHAAGWDRRCSSPVAADARRNVLTKTLEHCSPDGSHSPQQCIHDDRDG
ncbi:MAG: hypothetical protein RJA14_417 [Pseudomonadota bacterium]